MSFVGTGTASSLAVSGTLTAHRVAAPVTLTVTAVSSGPDGLRCRATARIDPYAFGVTTGRGLIGRYLDVELGVVSTPDSRSEESTEPGRQAHRD